MKKLIKIARNIASVLSFALGIFFLFHIAGDIQLGFGVALMTIGLLGIDE